MMGCKTSLLFGALLMASAMGGAQARDLTVTSWGGSYQDAQREVYFQPFMKQTGTKLVEDSWNGGVGALRAKVEGGNADWDVVQVEAEELVLGSGCTGAGQGADSDLARATEIALRLELTYGLSGHSLVHIADPARMLVSDPVVRARADRRLRTALRRARQLLAAEYRWLGALTDRLCAERVVTYGEDGLERPGPDPEGRHEP